MKAIDKFRVNWSKRERDLMIHFPLGYGTSSDGHWISSFFSKEFTAELEKRGYNIETFKFSIEPKKGNEKFSSQREDKND